MKNQAGFFLAGSLQEVVRNVLISGRPGGGGRGGGGGGITPGAYAGMARDLSTLSVHFKPWMGDWIAFTLS